MFEIIAISALTAFLVSALVGFAWGLTLRLRLWRLEAAWADVSTEVLRGKRQRAGEASAARRPKVNPIDQALVQQHTGIDLDAVTGSMEETVRRFRGPAG